VLEHLSSARLARIYVEIKGSQSTRPVLLKRTIGVIQRLDLEQIVTLLSFDHSIIGSAKQLAPRIRTAITIPGLVKHLPTARSIIQAAGAVQADEVALHFSIASPRIVRSLHQRGIQVSAWTANRKMVMRHLIAVEVDSIMTNHVDRLRSIIQAIDSTGAKGQDSRQRPNKRS